MDMYRSKGICSRCGSLPVESGKRSCESCLALIRSKRVRTERKKKSREEQLASYRLRNRRLREKVLDHYGRECKCCQETIEEFLSIDHINNDGANHRRDVRGGNSGNIYSWLVTNNFPAGFQTLCHNCNFAKGRYGACPHKASASERLNTGDVQQNR